MCSRVTVVVPVFNRVNELNQLISALEMQTLSRHDWDLLVCDDGSTEDLKSAINPTFIEIRWLRQERSGPAAARNLGLSGTTSDVVAFTDSDCIPGEGWLEELIRPIEAGEADVTGGFVGFDTAEEWIGRCVNYVMTTGIGAAGARDPRASIGMRFYPRSGNMAVRTDLARRAGGFPNERYGEDVEFGRRLTSHGARLVFVPQASVIHNEKRTIWQAGKEAFRKGVARIRLTRRYGLKEVIHVGPAGLVTYLALLPLAAMAWPRAGIVTFAPLALYFLALIVLAIQGIRALRDLRALVTIPVVTFVLHAGYGLGYLYAGARSLMRPPADGRPVPLLPPQSLKASPDLETTASRRMSTVETTS